MAVIIGGIAISQVTIIPVTSFLSSLYGWQISFVTQSIISLIAIVGILIFVPSIPVNEKLSYGNQLKILTKPRFIISIAFNICLISAWFSSYSYFADYLGRSKMMTGQQISYMLFVFGITGVFANWIAGKFLSKNITLTTVFFLSGTVILPVVFFYSANHFILQVLAVAFWGTMYGPAFITGISYMINAAPEAPEFANSLQSSFGNLGVSLGTTIGGWFIANHGIDNLPWIGACFGVIALGFIGLGSLVEKRCKNETIEI